MWLVYRGGGGDWSCIKLVRTKLVIEIIGHFLKLVWKHLGTFQNRCDPSSPSVELFLSLQSPKGPKYLGGFWPTTFVRTSFIHDRSPPSNQTNPFFVPRLLQNIFVGCLHACVVTSAVIFCFMSVHCGQGVVYAGGGFGGGNHPAKPQVAKVTEVGSGWLVFEIGK